MSEANDDLRQILTVWRKAEARRRRLETGAALVIAAAFLALTFLALWP